MSLPAPHACGPNSLRDLSLQYRSYLRPIIRWHYGSIDYLDPLLSTRYPHFQGSHAYTALLRRAFLRLVTPPGLRYTLSLIHI